MRWLLTVPAQADLDALARSLQLLDARLSTEPPVPLGHDEQTVGVTGPSDLPERVRAAGLPVVGIHPDSDMTYY